MQLPNAGMSVTMFYISTGSIGPREIELNIESIRESLCSEGFVVLERYLQGVPLSIVATSHIHLSDPVSVAGATPIHGPALIFKGPGLDSLSDFEIAMIRSNMALVNDSYICLEGVTSRPSKWKIVEGKVE